MLTASATQAQLHGGSPEITQVDSLLKTIYRDNEPGASIAILRNNVLFQRNYGLMDLETKQKITSKTNFNIALLKESRTMKYFLFKKV